MRRRVVALTAGALALASACATSTGSMANQRFGASPSAERPPSAAERDSLVAQAIADREGPRVDVRAEITQVSSSRRVRAAFNVEDDSYVLIGQVDASGEVRVVFPTDPKDDGFVRGGKSYETSEFFAGFTDQYRYRFDYTQYTRGYTPDSYDNGVGYVFIVASWRPMHFDKFSDGNEWDSFELADMQSLRDPRPAIYELASLLAGENREAYTVKFAKYYNTQNYAPYGNGRSALGYSMCSGFGYGFPVGFNGLGFGSPFSSTYYDSRYTYGENFTYRGQQYLYSAAGDCYYSQPLYYGNPYVIASAVPPVVPTKPHLSAGDSHRTPGDPRQPIGKIGPIVAKDVNPATQVHHYSPMDRQRGLLSDEDGTAKPGDRSRMQPTDRGATRPTIQQMVERHAREYGNGDNSGRSAFRGQPADANNRGWASRGSTNEPKAYNPPREPAYRGNANGVSSGYSGGNTGGGNISRGASDASRSPSGGYSGGGVSRSSGASSSGSTGGGVSPSSSSSSSGASSGAGSSNSAGTSSGGGGSPVKPPTK
jgi:hypothetical protein